jgi:signal transduction histidine kinase
VNSLLVISRADAGHIQLNRSAVSLLDLAKEASGLLEVLAEERGQRLSVEGDARIAVWADPLILRQALVNLIDNAIKYSPIGGAISVRTGARGAGEAIVEVIDTGPGIAAEHQSRVFERFYRVDKARSRDAGGAGLGLAIARWAVDAHGGGVELESHEGEGCTFRIVLPSIHTDKEINSHASQKQSAGW